MKYTNTHTRKVHVNPLESDRSKLLSFLAPCIIISIWESDKWTPHNREMWHVGDLSKSSNNRSQSSIFWVLTDVLKALRILQCALVICIAYSRGTSPKEKETKSVNIFWFLCRNQKTLTLVYAAPCLLT